MDRKQLINKAIETYVIASVNLVLVVGSQADTGDLDKVAEMAITEDIVDTIVDSASTLISKLIEKCGGSDNGIIQTRKDRRDKVKRKR